MIFSWTGPSQGRCGTGAGANASLRPVARERAAFDHRREPAELEPEARPAPGFAPTRKPNRRGSRAGRPCGGRGSARTSTRPPGSGRRTSRAPSRPCRAPRRSPRGTATARPTASRSDDVGARDEHGIVGRRARPEARRLAGRASAGRTGSSRAAVRRRRGRSRPRRPSRPRSFSIQRSLLAVRSPRDCHQTQAWQTAGALERRRRSARRRAVPFVHDHVDGVGRTSAIRARQSATRACTCGRPRRRSRPSRAEVQLDGRPDPRRARP